METTRRKFLGAYLDLKNKCIKEVDSQENKTISFESLYDKDNCVDERPRVIVMNRYDEIEYHSVESVYLEKDKLTLNTDIMDGLSVDYLEGWSEISLYMGILEVLSL